MSEEMKKILAAKLRESVAAAQKAPPAAAKKLMKQKDLAEERADVKSPEMPPAIVKLFADRYETKSDVQKWTRSELSELIRAWRPEFFEGKKVQRIKKAELVEFARPYFETEPEAQEEPEPEAQEEPAESSGADSDTAPEKGPDKNETPAGGEAGPADSGGLVQEPEDPTEPETGGLVLYVDCVPLRGGFRLLSDLLAPYMAKAAALDAKADIQDAEAYYGRFQYNRGPAFVAAKVLQDPSPFTGAIVAFSRDPVSDAVVEVLKKRAEQVVVRA